MKRGTLIAVAVLIIVIGLALVLLRSKKSQVPPSAPGGQLLAPGSLPAAPAGPQDLRIMTWNIRNFPKDDRPQTPDLDFSRKTNISDLRAVISSLHADLLGVEEIHRPSLLREVLRSSLGAGNFKAAFSRNGGRWAQHVGIIWNPTRLKLDGQIEEVGSIALTEGLRPGLAGYFKSRKDDGIDFSLMQVHLRATPRGYDQRIQQYRAIAAWVMSQVKKTGDEDVIIQGDFNTTGPVGGRLEDELKVADRILGRAGLRRIPNASGCSEYWEGPGRADGIQIPALLDQVYFRGMGEYDGSKPLRSWLHCERAGCDPLISSPDAPDASFWDVSDHCPVSFECRDKDLDPDSRVEQTNP